MRKQTGRGGVDREVEVEDISELCTVPLLLE